MNIKRKSLLHRTISLAILAILLYLFSVTFFSLFSKKSEIQQQYENNQFQLNKYSALVETLPQLEAKNKHLVVTQKNDVRYITSTNTSLAAAELQKKVQLLIQQLAAKLISLQVIKSDPEHGFQPITLKLQVRLTHAKLLNLLYQLENSKPSGFIYNLHIQQQRNYQKSDDILLDVRMEYTAFMVTPNER